MADEAYRLLQQDEDDVGEGPDSPTLTSPFLHQDGNGNGHVQYARRSNIRSNRRGRAPLRGLLGSVSSILCLPKAWIAIFLGLLTLLLGFAFWTPAQPPTPAQSPTPAQPPATSDAIFKVSLSRFQVKDGTNTCFRRRC